MDIDENTRASLGDPLGQLLRSDLDPLSIDELHGRIAILTAEIDRTKIHIEKSIAHRSGADSLFKR